MKFQNVFLWLGLLSLLCLGVVNKAAVAGFVPPFLQQVFAGLMIFAIVCGTIARFEKL